MYVALLRGINVGGKAKLPMKELIAIFVEAGAQQVQTYIQSGNVIFQAEHAEVTVEQVTREIAGRYGYPGRIVLRSAAELNATYERNPFAKAGAPVETLHVYFLAHPSKQAAVAKLDPNRSPGDTFIVSGRECFSTFRKAWLEPSSPTSTSTPTYRR